jgi:hypothetical protein
MTAWKEYATVSGLYNSLTKFASCNIIVLVSAISLHYMLRIADQLTLPLTNTALFPHALLTKRGLQSDICFLMQYTELSMALFAVY